MNPFITFRENDENGQLQYYVLQRAFPHFVAMISTVPVTGNWSSPVAGHYLWVVFKGSLRGNAIPSYNNVSEQIQTVMDNMAAWFHADRIVMDEKRFKRFKIKTDAKSPVQ